MLDEERRGGRPINQLRTRDKDRRQKKKELQVKNLFRRGGFDVPLFVLDSIAVSLFSNPNYSETSKLV